jgi:hypothetical protein
MLAEAPCLPRLFVVTREALVSLSRSFPAIALLAITHLAHQSALPSGERKEPRAQCWRRLRRRSADVRETCMTGQIEPTRSESADKNAIRGG